MGRVAAPFGVRGWIKVKPYSEHPDTLMDHPAWLLGRAGQWREMRVEDCRGHGEYLAALIEGVVDRDAAEALRGMEVALRRDALPEAEEDEYYWDDLLGLAVINRDGVALGRVDHLLETGANDVLVVKDEGVEGAPARERLIPFIAQVIEEVNPREGVLRVDWHPDD